MRLKFFFLRVTVYRYAARSRECIGSTCRSSQPRWPLTEGEQAAPRRVDWFFKLLRTAVRKDTLVRDFTAGPVSSFTGETWLAPLFYLATLQCHRSSSLRGDKEGTMLAPRRECIRSCHIIQNTRLRTSFQCFFLALFKSLYVRFFSRSFEAKLSRSVKESNLNI